MRFIHVGKHDTQTTKDALLQRTVIVDADVILDLAVVTNDYFIAIEYVLTKGNAFANSCSCEDMNKVRDTASFTDLSALIDNRTRMGGLTHPAFLTKGCTSPILPRVIRAVRISLTVSMKCRASAEPYLRPAKTSE